jgi:hypothetical protein
MGVYRPLTFFFTRRCPPAPAASEFVASFVASCYQLLDTMELDGEAGADPLIFAEDFDGVQVTSLRMFSFVKHKGLTIPQFMITAAGTPGNETSIKYALRHNGGTVFPLTDFVTCDDDGRFHFMPSFDAAFSRYILEKAAKVPNALQADPFASHANATAGAAAAGIMGPELERPFWTGPDVDADTFSAGTLTTVTDGPGSTLAIVLNRKGVQYCLPLPAWVIWKGNMYVFPDPVVKCLLAANVVEYLAGSALRSVKLWAPRGASTASTASSGECLYLRTGGGAMCPNGPTFDHSHPPRVPNLQALSPVCPFLPRMRLAHPRTARTAAAQSTVVSTSCCICEAL